MTALAHFMGLACFFKRHRCCDGRAELAGFNQGRYLDKLIGVRLNRYHVTPNTVFLAGIFRLFEIYKFLKKLIAFLLSMIIEREW
jgi:hypothetical protein